MVEKTKEIREQRGEKKHSKALRCLNVISDRSNRRPFREKKQRIQKKTTLLGFYYFISATEGESLTKKDKEMRSE